jgi:hypothetical protein
MMRDFRDAKAMARALRGGLAVQGVTVTHSQSLELVAVAFGYDNWNILAAKIEAAQPAQVEATPKGKATLFCSFCGKSQQEVKTLIAGPDSFICDECVGLCTDIIEHNAVLALLAADERDGDGLPRVGAYLDERTSEQLRAYLTRVERDLTRMRESLRGADEAVEARAEKKSQAQTFKHLSDDELAKQRARLNWQVGGTRKIIEIIAWTLEARE